jgi:hypothetical protein
MNLIQKQADGAPNSTCERCGKKFHCGASLLGCWCSEIKLSEEARAHLRRSYQGCLCRECMIVFAGPDETWKTPT